MISYSCARYYDSQIGRFISNDPLEFEGEDTNFYAYVGNATPSYFDPFGLQRDRYPNQGTVPGTRAKYRMDMHQQPEPNMHVYWPDGNESVITARGGWARMHGGKPMAKPPRCYRPNLRPVVNSFLERVAGRFLEVVQWITFPIEEYTQQTELNNRAKENNRTPYEQFCSEMQAAGNPEYYISPVGLTPNPCGRGHSL